ncbi:MAG: glycosyltransferase [Bacteroidales bacterium]|nr:glycosyltransferase [Bacteroidales bacterium]
MPNKPRQIFQTDEPKRWKRFQWLFRSFLVVFTLLSVTFTISILGHQQKIKLPELEVKKQILKKLTTDEMSAAYSPQARKEFKSDIRKIRSLHKDHDLYEKKVALPANREIEFPIRAAFYVNWDPQARYSLEYNASELNMVLPEWFFVTDSTDEIAVKIDSVGLDIMRKEKVAIVPMITNIFKGSFNGKNVNRIISSSKRRTTFINSVVKVLDKYKFQGVNIDFENLEDFTKREYIVAFQKELYETLHTKKYIVTQDIQPYNDAYDLKQLAKRNDFIFLMAYDQHNAPGLPGPIAAQKWVEEAMNEALKEIPSNKLILCIPSYGYDWPEGCQGTSMSYQKAITKASQTGAKINYDNNSYNLNYDYWDDNKVKHTVFFADAATNFNAMRASEDFGAAGVALWRLGAEDIRIWQFFARDLSFESLKEDKFDYTVLRNSKSNYNIDFTGSGEIYDIQSLPIDGLIDVETTSGDELITEENYKILPASCSVFKSGFRNEKWVSITFDDGPSEEYTPKILDILSKYHVRATFFIIGTNGEDNLPIVDRIYREGHELGNHTYTHTNLSTAGVERAKIEIRSTNKVIQAATGHSTMLFRSPYTSEPRSLDEFIPLFTAKEEGLITVSSSYDPRDWEAGVSADTILERIETANRYGNIVLLHDAGGDRTQTILALPRIIEYFQKQGYKFVTVADLMGKKRADIMPKIPENYESFVDQTVVEGTYYWQSFLFALFLVALVLSTSKLILLVVLAVINRSKEKRRAKINQADTTFRRVSIIVPAYNEEVNIEKSLLNLLKIDYANYNIVFVDDGSKDSTYQKVYDRFNQNEKMKVFTKPNGGKASALNFGIEQADGEILVCIDADTILKPDSISLMVKQFHDDEVAAVAGNVKVGNRRNLLTNWQSIEYITSQNFDRRAFDFLNAIMVVPGAIGAFRREALIEVGGFTVDTLAEDCDLTMRFLRAGYKVTNCNEALSFTEAPETLNMFVKQRFRWSFGIMQSFWKHKELLFNLKQPNLGWVILPNVLIFQMILPLFSPIVDILMIYSIFWGNSDYVLEFYLGFLLFDSAISYVAFHYDNEKFTFRTFWLFALQRILYRQIMWFVLIKAYNKAIKGEMAHWGVLKRTGNVEDKTV